MSFKKIVLLGVLPFIAPFATDAQEELAKFPCKQLYSLEEFRAVALHQSSVALEIDRDFSYKLAEAFEARTLPNPEISVEKTFKTGGVQADGSAQSEVALSQPFRLSHFGTRQSFANLIKEAGSVARKRELLKLLLSNTYRFHQLTALGVMKDVLENAEKRASTKVKEVEEGVEKGLFSSGEMSLFVGEKFRLIARRKGVESEFSALQQLIASEIRLDCLPLPNVAQDVTPLPSITVLLEKADSSPLTQRSRAELLLQMASKRVEVAELDMMPEIVPRAVYQRTNDGGDFVGAGISIALPIWNQNQSERMKAASEERLLRRKRDVFSGGGFENQVRMLYDSARSASERTSLYVDHVVPSFEAALLSEERKYEKGGGNVLQVWQTLRAYYDAQIESQRLTLSSYLLRIELSLLVGEEV